MVFYRCMFLEESELFAEKKEKRVVNAATSAADAGVKDHVWANTILCLRTYWPRQVLIPTILGEHNRSISTC